MHVGLSNAGRRHGQIAIVKCHCDIEMAIFAAIVLLRRISTADGIRPVRYVVTYLLLLPGWWRPQEGQQRRIQKA